jgi:alpha-mannosidase
LENENIKVVIHSNGTFSLTNKKTGKTMDNMHYFTDSGEHGSAHVSCQPTRNYVVTSLGSPATITMMESNAQRGVFRIDLSMQIPAAATDDGKNRLNERKELPITTWLTLEKGSEMLKIKTILHNDCRDHKLVVNFPSKVDTDWAHAEGAWDVLKRTIKWTVDGDNQEKFQPFQPMQNFVDLSDGKEGLALLNRGLREYEVQDDDDRTLMLTLLRTQRAYMTATADMIPEELAQYTGQHSIGKMEFEYALYPHSGDWFEGDVFQKAYGFKTDMNAIKGVVKDGVLPATGSFIQVSDEKRIMVSAIKQSEDKSGIIVRLFNTTGEDVKFDVNLMLPVTSVTELKLNETVLKEVDVKDGKFSAELGPHKIITFLLKA